MKSIPIVSVIKLDDDVAVQFAAYPDNVEGNAAAEAKFLQWIADAGCEPYEWSLEDGFFEVASGATIIICHSTE